MDQGALVTEQFEAGNRFLSEFEKSTSVVAAFWLKEDVDSRWKLHIASDRYNSGRVRDAYGDVLRIVRELRDPYLREFQVKLVGLDEPPVPGVLDYYSKHPPKIPFRIRQQSFGGITVEEVYLVRGPTGGYVMPSGREVLDQIIDQEAAFYKQHGKPPRKMNLPVLMAYDLAKCGRNEVGELSGKVFKDGIAVFEKEGFHGMSVEIVRDRNATLQFE